MYVVFLFIKSNLPCGSFILLNVCIFVSLIELLYFLALVISLHCFLFYHFFYSNTSFLYLKVLLVRWTDPSFLIYSLRMSKGRTNILSFFSFFFKYFVPSAAGYFSSFNSQSNINLSELKRRNQGFSTFLWLSY